ncbi:MAG: hypothetical protein HZA84_02550 [Thaumarchaeota archaeon]|nr:hypothetical protein [Nitrososphaerota archaeon]
MKTRLLVAFGIILIIISAVNYTAYGLWEPETTERLLEQSETVFVGTITSVNVLEFERSNTYDVVENGVSRIIIENYTQTLDEYTVSIEEFLKNPQESHTITMLEATVGGVPGRSVSIGGFELGDRVLFYVPKIDGTNQYSPESFKIPKHCDAKSVLEKPRIDGVNDFRMMQDGTIIQNNFTANKKIQFVFDKDLRTLNGSGFSVDVAISKIIDKKNRQPILQESIHAESKQCEWVATAKWDFVPTAGEYTMWMSDAEDGYSGRSTYSGGFSVIENTSIKTQLNPYVSDTLVTSPLQQFKSGIPLDKIQCKDNLQLVIKTRDSSPACVKSGNKAKLIERKWATVIIHESDQVKITGDDAWTICGALRIPCPSNPVFSGTKLDDNIIVKISGNGDPYEVRLNQTSVCVMLPSEETECHGRH